ncbi:MAG: hypothetical protein K2Q20_04480 [Phycisphaerales bacterium]|nr:hypothetical protein [Phycisphaerales bacterium]
MTAKTWRLVLVQAVVLIAIGSAVGVIDAFRRPINLSRATVDPASLLNSGTQPAATQPTTPPRTEPNSPTTVAPAQPVSEPATPAATSGPVAPGDPGWTPTAESALPKGQITIDQAKRFFDMGAQFVDTRKKDEYEAGHVKDAMRISLSNFQKGDPALLGMIPRDAIVVAYCNGGHCDESEAVARMISGSGYAKVFVLHDGFPGWKAMGHPVQTGAGLQAE